MFAIRLGTSEQFACVRELLRRGKFTALAIVPFVDVHDLAETETKTAKEKNPADPFDLLQLFIQLFLDGVYVRAAAARVLVSTAEFDALIALGLAIPDHANGTRIYSPVKLYPIDPVFVACDRWSNPDGSPFRSFPEILYPPVGPNTKLFLELLPDSPCEALLDLCSGTAVAGLIGAARYAKHAWAFDITQRCAHFAEFNRRLNGLENLSPGTGDLYAPAGELTFDRVVAHPPYVPVLEPKWVFYGGGEDGEQVTRRIVSGLPRHLRPGGALHCLAVVTERQGEALEDRVRQWLGPAQQDFDVALVTRKSIPPEQFTVGTVLKQGGSLSDTVKMKALFRELKVTALTYTMIMVQHRASARNTFTVRRQAGPNTSRAEHAWLLNWETAAAAPSSDQLVLDARLKPSPRCEMLSLHRLQDGDWAAAGYKLQIDFPFSMEMEMEPWIGLLIPRCAAGITGKELFAALRQEGVLHAATPIAEFAALLRNLVSGGFLVIMPH